MKNVDFAWISPKSHREFRQDYIYSFENDTIKCTHSSAPRLCRTFIQ